MWLGCKDVNMRRIAPVVMLVALSAGCGGATTATALRPVGFSDKIVCTAFNRAASPVLQTRSSEEKYAKTMANASDPELRKLGESLVHEGDHGGDIFPAGNPFDEIGSICVAKGLTPKYWSQEV
jgi:hypothetical protein